MGSTAERSPVADAGGLLEFCTNQGLEQFENLMAAEVTRLVGQPGTHNPHRTARRNGYAAQWVVVGSRMVRIRRPRVVTMDGKEVRLRTVEDAAASGPLTCSMITQMRVGTSTRKFARTRQAIGPRGDNDRGASKSRVSEELVRHCTQQYGALMNRSLADLRLAAMMIDGYDLKGRCVVLALGFDTNGEKIALGIYDGSTENATLVDHLLSDLVDRGLDPSQGVLAVIDGSKALRRGITDVFGPDTPVQRCQVHKRENVTHLLPKDMREAMGKRIDAAYRRTDPDDAERALREIAAELDRHYPGAASSMREGLAETLTLQRLGVHPDLWVHLRSTNPIESLIASCRAYARNVKRWANGHMCLRWTAAALLDAEPRLRRAPGDHRLAELALIVARSIATRDDALTVEDEVAAWSACLVESAIDAEGASPLDLDAHTVA